MFGLYAAGIVSALGVSFVAKFFFWRDNPTPPFMLELPDYKLPRPRSVADRPLHAGQDVPAARRHDHLLDDGVDLVPGLVPASAGRQQAGRRSTTASPPGLGTLLEPVLAPIGFNWQINVALIPGMAAREVAVAALGTVYSIEGGKEAAEQIGQALAQQWSLATALSLLVWYIFAPQCASTLAVIKRETGSWQWMAVTFGYMLSLAYVASFVTYNIAVALRRRLNG